jgi:putative RecB family exonuclease
MVVHTHETQTTAYAVLYREATGQSESGIELHHLIKTKVPKLVVTELEAAGADQITRLFRVMEDYVHGLEHESFVPAPGLQCSSCDFFTECRAWR